MKTKLFAFTTLLLSTLLLAQSAFSQEAVWPAQTFYRSVNVNGHNIFYREAGDPNKPTLLLLHGYPSSSHAFRHLIPLLSGSYHVVAPDNLGSGYSDKPDSTEYPYTFDLLANVMEGFVKTLDLKKYSIYMHDFGAPVGFRLMMQQPERLSALITQNGNAYLDGLTQPRQDFFKQAHFDKSDEMQKKLYNFTGLEGIRDRQYLRDVQGKEETMSPDAWNLDLHFLESKQQRLIQVQLLQDYYNNLLSYPKWQDFLRKSQPPTLIVWGKNDPAFNENGARAFLRDIPDAELNLLDAGHFALEEKPVEIAQHILRFMSKQSKISD